MKRKNKKFLVKVWGVLRDFFNRHKAMMLNPPAHVLNKDKSLKSFLAADWRLILAIDVIIWLSLLNTINQMAHTFGRGEVTMVSLTKAFVIDFSMWILMRTISRTNSLNDRVNEFIEQKSGSKRFISSDVGFNYIPVLWGGLALFVSVSMTANMMYEMWEPGVLGRFAFSIPDSYFALLGMLLSSFLIAPIIIFMTVVRTILENSMSKTHKALQKGLQVNAEEFKKKEDRREYQRRYREKQVANVNNAALVRGGKKRGR